uniref:Polyprotein n=1 Tax=Cajanus cajan TaxID=3821 RepID=A0A151R2X7_CAJCA|nr:hypothetical protein KK1_041984 [Cajanus cajan]
MINFVSEESDSTSDEESNTEIIYQLEEEDSNSSLEDECCLGPELCTYTDCKTINMLTSEQTHTLIDLISQLEDGLETKILGNNLCFEFIYPPRSRELNLLKENSTSFITNKRKHINFLSKEIQYKRIEEQLQNKNLQETIKVINDKIEKEICELNPTAFWHRKKYEVSLPYIDNFDGETINTKARPIQMNTQYLEYCKKEIQEYLDKGLIRNSKSPWRYEIYQGTITPIQRSVEFADKFPNELKDKTQLQRFLNFQKWFLQWFYYWGPIRELFRNEVSENYDYFKEKTSFLPNFKLISFVASQNITWIV